MFSPIMIIIAILSLAYVGYLFFESIYHKRLRKKLKLVVHVNGTRGKSTTTRLIAAGLRECGYKVFCKSTGTIPMTIGVDNVQKKINRLGPANIREQLKILRMAVKDGADALVIECMAVNPELQYITEHKILNSDISVITNVRADHLDVMGTTLESVALALANTTPSGGTLILGEDKFTEIFKKCAQKANAKLVVAKPYDGDKLDTFSENIGLSLEVCDQLNLDRTAFFEGLKNYKRDPGALKTTKKGDTTFINAFSVNDPESTLKVYEEVTKDIDQKTVSVVINTRQDRVFRIDQHVKMLDQMTFNKVILVGSFQQVIAKHLEKQNIPYVILKDIKDLLSEQVIFGCGNIKGDGMRIINFFEEGDNL